MTQQPPIQNRPELHREDEQLEVEQAAEAQPASALSDFASLSGNILALSYPILALSTGVRAVYQLFFKAGVTEYLPPTLSAVAASCYLLATIGFTYRRKWAWWLSVGLLGFETFLTFLVGTLSFIYPDLIGNTVWRHFGADYGFFPLFQPLLGLAWLFRGETLQAYGIDLFSQRNKGAGLK